MMNKLKYGILLAGILYIASACDTHFLSDVPQDRLTLDHVFQREDLSRQYLANIYSYIKGEAYKTNNPGATPWDILSEDMDNTYDRDTDPAGFMNLGSWTVSDYFYDYWPHYYQGIRKATYFMNHIDQNKNVSGATKVRWKAEARFLRAWFYFALLRQYGPVVLVRNKVIPLDKPFAKLQMPRSPYDEDVDYIAAQLDSAAQNLPLDRSQQQDRNWGRATKEMCWAVKARMFLYAASPQFNGNPAYANVTNPDGTHLFSQTYDKDKWARADSAAKKIIDSGVYSLYRKNDSNGDYSPFLSERDVWLDPWNSAVIWARPGNQIEHAERTTTPRPAGGYSGLGITQSLVDAFYMKNGKEPITGYKSNGQPIINPDAGYTETGFSTKDRKFTKKGTYMMWVNREPRFYVNVYYNGEHWINHSNNNDIHYYSYFTGSSGKDGSMNFSKTGYMPKKNIDPETDFRGNVKFSPRPYVMMRYAEILLDYVEALNEYDPGNADILKYLNKIREHAGISDVPGGLTQDQMREKIHHERRVELAEENSRYFDTRRWLIAEKTDAGPMYGMNINEDPPKFYNRRVFETRIFRKKYYLFPIYQRYLDRDKNLVQNPGW